MPRWIHKFADNGWMDHICSECSFIENTDVHVNLNWNFCPICGADMRKERIKEVMEAADAERNKACKEYIENDIKATEEACNRMHGQLHILYSTISVCKGEIQ